MNTYKEKEKVKVKTWRLKLKENIKGSIKLFLLKDPFKLMEYIKKIELVLESIQTKPGQKQLRLSKVLARFYFKEFKLIQCLRHTSPPMYLVFPVIVIVISAMFIL